MSKQNLVSGNHQMSTPEEEKQSFLKLVLGKKTVMALAEDSQSKIWGGVANKSNKPVLTTKTTCYSCVSSNESADC